MKIKYLLVGAVLAVAVILGIAASVTSFDTVVASFIGNGASITNIPGSGLQASSVNSNRFDAPTLALFGVVGSSGIPTLMGVGTNTQFRSGSVLVADMAAQQLLINGVGILDWSGTNTAGVRTIGDHTVTSALKVNGAARFDGTMTGNGGGLTNLNGQLASFTGTGLTADGNGTLVTAPGAGTYEVSGYVEVTTSGTATLTVAVGWTDAVGATTQTTSALNLASTGRFSIAPFPLHLASGSVVYTNDFTITSGSPVANVYLWIRR